MLNQVFMVLVTIVVAVLLSWFALKPANIGSKDSGKDASIFYETLNGDVKIAIIGAGIGGSSASYFIRRHLGSRAQITVFEQSNKIGGRVAVEEMNGRQFEAGGSILHSSNRYMVEFIKKLGLETFLRGIKDGTFGLYNGNEFVFTESENSFITKLKMLWRYGFFSCFYLEQSLSKMLEMFQNIYNIQDEEKAFRSVLEMLKAMGGDAFFNYTQKTAEEVMLKNGIGELLIQELVTAVTRNNYGQDSKVNAFTGYVSMAGAQGGSLFAVKHGNFQVPKKLLENSNATVLLNHHIDSIRKETHKGKIVYFLDEKINPPSKDAYDAVIVAAPLEVPKYYMKCAQCREWPEQSHLGNYQLTIATFVQADINFNHFNVEGKNSTLSDIFTTENLTIPFSSIGRQRDTNSSEVKPRVYKIFSRKPLQSKTIKELFKIGSSVDLKQKSIHWLAYPHYTPPEKFSPFVFDDAVFYVNAIERAASAMEMSAIGGRNAALLTKRYFLDKREKKK